MDHEEVSIDLSFLDGINPTDKNFKRDVLDIFLTNTIAEVAKLEHYVRDGAELEVIYKQAHLLKSSFSVVKVGNINELLMKIQTLSKKADSRKEIETITAELVAKFNSALPLLEAERNKP